MRGLLMFLVVPVLCAAEFQFELRRESEVIAEVEMSSPGSSWVSPGKEAAIAQLTVDGKQEQHVVVVAGQERYRVFLGRLPKGKHSLAVARHATLSAAGSGFEVRGARFDLLAPGDANWQMIAHAPAVMARTASVEKFSDVPLLAYCEKLADGANTVLQYTIIFSNEDGGTSTRALMARWGRTTDIEYLYRVTLDASGKRLSGIIQAKDHKDLEFGGVREGDHPLLLVSTMNNMVSDAGTSPVRFQLAPELVDLSNASREIVMDRHPILYRISSEELEREGKLRPFGTVDGQKISDPRNYAMVEAKLENRGARAIFGVKLQGKPEWYDSHLGRPDYGIERSGWVRSAIELPPGTKPDQIAEIRMGCLAKEQAEGICRLEEGVRVVALDQQYQPVNVNGWRSDASEIKSGDSKTVAIR